MADLNDINIGSVKTEDSKEAVQKVVKQLNEWGRMISNEDRTKVIKSNLGVEVLTFGQLPGGGNGLLTRDADGTKRALFGQEADGDISLKISQTGVDVTTATDSQLIFNSNQNLLKIVQTGTASLSGSASLGAGNSQTVTIPHNLGSVPVHFVYTNSPAYAQFFSLNGGVMPLPITYILSNPLTWLGSRVDSTNLYIDLTNVTGSSQNLSAYSWTFKYYILQETAH